jgi:lantibiotic biosynthesis protein
MKYTDTEFNLLLYDLNSFSLCDDSLTKGNLGKVIFYMARGEYLNTDDDIEAGLKLLKSCINNLLVNKSSLRTSVAISKGLSGVGILLHLLSDQCYIEEDITLKLLHRKLENMIYIKCVEEIAVLDLDPLHSSIGGIYYLTLRSKSNKDAALLAEKLLEQLFQKLEETAGGIRLKNLRYVKDQPHLTNIGLAHGMCGMILMMLEAYTSGLATEKIGSIIHSMIGYILSSKSLYNDIEYEYLFPRLIADSGERFLYQVNEVSPMGWCYSDLSIAVMLFKAGKCLGKDEYTIEAINIAKNSLARRTFSTHKIDESHLCHGTSGIALLFKKCYELSNEACFLEGVDYWVENTLQLLKQKSVQSPTSEMNQYLLSGDMGSLIVLMTLKGSVKFKWDKLFYL